MESNPILITKRKLGNSGIEVSEISFGCMSLEPDSTESEPLLRQAYDYGINYFDTADLYDKGKNEEIVGKALSDIRDKVIIGTKVGNVWDKSGSDWHWDPSPKHIKSAIDESLKRLKTDYLDLYMLHGGTLDDPIDDIIRTFQDLKSSGKIRAFGISSIRPNVIRTWLDKTELDAVMLQYSLADRRPEEELLSMLKESNTGVLARGTLAKGMLIDKPEKEYLNYSADDIRTLQKALKQTGNPVGASLHYVLNNNALSSAVVGIRTENQLKSIIHHKGRIEQDFDDNSLSGLLKPNFYVRHRK